MNGLSSAEKDLRRAVAVVALLNLTYFAVEFTVSSRMPRSTR
jgi:Co/Zn/Cd efflux system component